MESVFSKVLHYLQGRSLGYIRRNVVDTSVGSSLPFIFNFRLYIVLLLRNFIKRHVLNVVD